MIASGAKENPSKLETITLARASINVFPENIVVICKIENPKLLIIIAFFNGYFYFLKSFSNIPLNITSSENPAVIVPISIINILIQVILSKDDIFLYIPSMNVYIHWY